MLRPNFCHEPYCTSRQHKDQKWLLLLIQEGDKEREKLRHTLNHKEEQVGAKKKEIKVVSPNNAISRCEKKKRKKVVSPMTDQSVLVTDRSVVMTDRSALVTDRALLAPFFFFLTFFLVRTALFFFLAFFFWSEPTLFFMLTMSWERF